MQKNGLEIKSYDGSGYEPLISFESWRVAMLNHQPSQERGQIPYLERHHETDEVFVLLNGTATLLLGGGGERPDEIDEAPMELNKIYNVPKDMWHAVITSPDSKLLIVENADTSEANSSHFYL